MRFSYPGITQDDDILGLLKLLTSKDPGAVYKNRPYKIVESLTKKYNLRLQPGIPRCEELKQPIQYATLPLNLPAGNLFSLRAGTDPIKIF